MNPKSTHACLRSAMSYYCPIWVPPPLKAGPHQGIRSSQIFASGPMAIAHPIKCWKAGPDFRMNICAAIFAHNEERRRSEEHTSELQSLMRISYAVFCLEKKK